MLSRLTEFLHDEMPLTRAMGVSVVGWDGRTVRLIAPLGPNLNHADTAFGGSISTLGILAGYMLLHVLLEERRISTRILIQESSTRFLRPIDGEMAAEASVPAGKKLEEFFAALARKRRGRIALDSQVLAGASLAATHSGLFIAMLY